MVRAISVFACSACGAQTPKWQGQCPQCAAWNSLEKRSAGVAGARAGREHAAAPQSLAGERDRKRRLLLAFEAQKLTEAFFRFAGRIVDRRIAMGRARDNPEERQLAGEGIHHSLEHECRKRCVGIRSALFFGRAGVVSFMLELQCQSFVAGATRATIIAW